LLPKNYNPDNLNTIFKTHNISLLIFSSKKLNKDDLPGINTQNNWLCHEGAEHFGQWFSGSNLSAGNGH